jgi:hypothetical protein
MIGVVAVAVVVVVVVVVVESPQYDLPSELNIFSCKKNVKMQLLLTTV